MKAIIISLLVSLCFTYRLQQTIRINGKMHKRSPLQLPDEIAYTGEKVVNENEDGIAKASDSDIQDYSVAIATGGAQAMIDALEGPPKNAEDDSGSIALLMEENIRDSN